MKTSNLEPSGVKAGSATIGSRSTVLAGAKGMIWRDASTESVGQIRDMTVVGGDFHDNEDGTGVLTINGEEGGQTDIGQVTLDMLNNSGADLAKGATVVVDDTADMAVTTTTDVASILIVGVTADVIEAGQTGPVIFNGYAAEIVTAGDVTRGEYAQTSSTAGAATSTAAREAGSFGVYLTGTGIADFAEWAEVTEEPTDVTSLAITLQTSTVGRVLFIALYLDPAMSATAVTLTGWTLIGSTAGFRYYYRVAVGADTATATWSGGSPAIAIAAQLSGLVDSADPIAAFAYDSTTAAAAVSGMSAAFRYAVAAVAATPATPAGWDALAASTVLSSGGSAPADLLSGITLTQEPSNTSNWSNPSRVNDANGVTAATANSSGDPHRQQLIADLGAPAAVSTMWSKITDSGSDTLNVPEYSDDGSTWTTITGSWGAQVSHGSMGLCRQLTITGGPITHRYFRGGSAGTGGHGNKSWYVWEIIGTFDTTVAGSLVGKYIGTSATATSPFTGAAAQNDAIIVFNLTARPHASVLLYGPDLGGAGADILDLPTAETDTTLVLAPDGTGGVTFRAETGSGVFLTSGTGERHQVVIAVSGAALELDLSTGNWFDVTLDDDCTLSFVNPPASGIGGEWTIILRQGGAGSFTVTMPAEVVWRDTDGTTTTTAPDLATAVGAVDAVALTTLDGGASYGAALDNGGSSSTPAATVTDETTLGIAPAVGTDTEYARQDHTHGTPDEATVAALVPAGLLTVDAGTTTYSAAGDDVTVTYATVWGYDADGPYYDSAGAVDGEQAILALDPSTGELAAIPMLP